MSNGKTISRPVKKLIKHFGGQVATAQAMNVTQGTVTGWLNKVHGVSKFNAEKAEILTKGAVRASDLCASIKELENIKKAIEADEEDKEDALFINTKKLDCYETGFKIASRRPHRDPVAKNRKKSARSYNPSTNVFADVQRDLKSKTIIYVADYSSRTAVASAVGKLRMYGWVIKARLNGRKAVAYELVKAP